MTATYKNGDITVRALTGLFYLELAVVGILKAFDGSLLGWIAATSGLLASFFSFKGSAASAARDIGQRRTVLLVASAVALGATTMWLLDLSFD